VVVAFLAAAGGGTERRDGTKRRDLEDEEERKVARVTKEVQWQEVCGEETRGNRKWRRVQGTAEGCGCGFCWLFGFGLGVVEV